MKWELILKNKFSGKLMRETIFARFYFSFFFLEELNILNIFLSKMFIYRTYYIIKLHVCNL